MNPNPPIKGHELIAKGQTWRSYHDKIWLTLPVIDGWIGGCRCGARPDRFPLRINAMRVWHREHKEEIRKAQNRQLVATRRRQWMT